MSGRQKIVLIVLAVLITLSSCMVVAVEKSQQEADSIIKKARERALKISSGSSTGLRPHRLKVLIYDPDDSTLLRISLPFWVVRKIAVEDMRDAARRNPQGFEFDVQGFSRALLEMPRGLLVEVSGEKERVLVWLE
ncbi:MAG: hypothetical protein WBI18_06165 [Candidatus Saccharicenans sp.]